MNSYAQAVCQFVLSHFHKLQFKERICSRIMGYLPIAPVVPLYCCVPPLLALKSTVAWGIHVIISGKDLFRWLKVFFLQRIWADCMGFPEISLTAFQNLLTIDLCHVIEEIIWPYQEKNKLCDSLTWPASDLPYQDTMHKLYATYIDFQSPWEVNLFFSFSITCRFISYNYLRWSIACYAVSLFVNWGNAQTHAVVDLFFNCV